MLFSTLEQTFPEMQSAVVLQAPALFSLWEIKLISLAGPSSFLPMGDQTD
jgi:hypothetical protein